MWTRSAAGSRRCAARMRQLEPLLKSLGVATAVQPRAGSDYTVDHSATLFFLECDAAPSAAVFTPPFDHARLRADLLTLLSSGTESPTMASLFVTLQYVLPHHLISRVVLVATRIRFAPSRTALIALVHARLQARHERRGGARIPSPMAASMPSSRARCSRARGRSPATRGRWSSPVDGTLSQSGAHRRRRNCCRPRATHYSLDALLAGAAGAWAAKFRDGQFATIYLAPYNYHRIHMPCGRHAAGGLVRAGPAVQRQQPLPRAGARTCSRATSAWCCCSTALRAVRRDLRRRAERRQHGDGVAWRCHAALAARASRACRCRRQPNARSQRGAEVGRFNMGSTVILLFGPRGASRWMPTLRPAQHVRMGAAIGQLGNRTRLERRDWRAVRDWHPRTLRAARARLLRSAREFFRERRRAGGGDAGGAVATPSPIRRSIACSRDAGGPRASCTPRPNTR